MADVQTSDAAPIVRHGLFDIQIELPEGIYSPNLERIISEGGYERIEGQIAIKALQNGKANRILELGGGLGLLSSLISKRSLIKSYDLVEANPNLIPVIKRTHELNGVIGVNVHNFAVTSEQGSIKRGWCRLNVANNFQASSLLPVDDERLRETIKVAAVPFSAALSETDADVLICDIEGAEVSLLKNIDGLHKVKIVIIEIHPKMIGARGTYIVFERMSFFSFSYDAELSTGQVVVFRKLPSSAFKN